MNFTKFFILFIGLSVLASCSDDDTNNSNNVSVVGNWLVTGIDYGGTSSIEVPGEDIITSVFTGTGTDMDLEITFDDNPNNYSTSGDYSVLLDVNTQGITQQQTWTNQGFIGDGTWDRSGNTLTITDSSGQENVTTIQTLNETTLVIEWAFINTFTQNGAIFVQDVQGTYTFERQ